MRFLTIVAAAAAIGGCAALSREERAAIDARAAASMWPLADGFWWEYADTASPSGSTVLTVTGPREIDFCDVEREEWWQNGMDVKRRAWIVRGLWSHDACLLVEPSRLLLAVERRLGYAGVPGIVAAYEFRWDRGAWDIRSMDG